ncbi:MAG: metallophosphoesterase [Desulfobacterales bacterium]
MQGQRWIDAMTIQPRGQNKILSLWSRAIRSAYSYAPDARFIIHAGDLVNRANSDQQWSEWFKAGGWIFAMTPSIPSAGNHEYEKEKNNKRKFSNFWRPQFNFLKLPAFLLYNNV